jgi:adenylosuccinate lyase
VSEGIQTMLRRHGYPRPYEALKELTRGREVDHKRIQRFIESLDLKDGAREALKKLAPRNYTGLASKLVEMYAPSPEGDRKHRGRD